MFIHKGVHVIYKIQGISCSHTRKFMVIHKGVYVHTKRKSCSYTKWCVSPGEIGQLVCACASFMNISGMLCLLLISACTATVGQMYVCVVYGVWCVRVRVCAFIVCVHSHKRSPPLQCMCLLSIWIIITSITCVVRSILLTATPLALPSFDIHTLSMQSAPYFLILFALLVWTRPCCVANPSYWLCALLIAHCPLLNAHCSMCTAHCPLLIAHCSMLTAQCALRTAYCSPPTALLIWAQPHCVMCGDVSFAFCILLVANDCQHIGTLTRCCFCFGRAQP